MIRLLKKLYSFHYKFCITTPKSDDIIIFDKEGSSEIAKYIIKQELNFNVYDHKVIKIYINIKFLFKYISNLLSRWDNTCSASNNMYIKYIVTEIMFIQPKIVITYNDDNYIYHKIKKILSNIKFIAIQNGLREKVISSKILHEINHDDLYCYGSSDNERFNNLGWNINNLYPVGSLRAGIAYSKYHDEQIEYDIAYISEYHSDDNYQADVDWLERHYKIDNIFSEIVNNNDYSIVVLLGTKNKKEKEYYNTLFNGNVSFSDPNKYLDSYRFIFKSKLIIGFCSTLLVESVGLDKKVLAIDIDKNTEDSSTFFSYNELKHYYSTIEELKNHIDGLLHLSYKEYKNNMKTVKKSVMNLDIKKPPHLVISNSIHQILKSYEL